MACNPKSSKLLEIIIIQVLIFKTLKNNYSFECLSFVCVERSVFNIKTVF